MTSLLVQVKKLRKKPANELAVDIGALEAEAEAANDGTGVSDRGSRSVRGEHAAALEAAREAEAQRKRER